MEERLLEQDFIVCFCRIVVPLSSFGLDFGD